MTNFKINENKIKKYLIKKDKYKLFVYKYTKNKEHLKKPIGEIKIIEDKENLVLYSKSKK